MLSLFKRKPKEEPVASPRTTVSKAKPKPKPKQKRSKRRNFSEIYPDDAVIHVLTDCNPKRPGTKSHEAFRAYYSGTSSLPTVAYALKFGVTYRQIDYDVEHGFIKVGSDV